MQTAVQRDIPRQLQTCNACVSGLAGHSQAGTTVSTGMHCKRTRINQLHEGSQCGWHAMHRPCSKCLMVFKASSETIAIRLHPFPSLAAPGERAASSVGLHAYVHYPMWWEGRFSWYWSVAGSCMICFRWLPMVIKSHAPAARQQSVLMPQEQPNLEDGFWDAFCARSN